MAIAKRNTDRLSGSEVMRSNTRRRATQEAIGLVVDRTAREIRAPRVRNPEFLALMRNRLAAVGITPQTPVIVEQADNNPLDVVLADPFAQLNLD